MRTGRTIIAAVVLAAAVAGGLIVWRGRAAPAGTAPPVVAAAETATVERTDLATAVAVAGKVGFGAERAVTGPKEGTVTWLPATGATVSRGEPLMRVDDRPVLLFYGETPMFRALDGVGLVGRDVKVVADNLKAMGYAVGAQPAVGTSVTPPKPPAAPEPGPSASPEPKPAAASSAPRVLVRPGDGVLTARLQAAIKKWQAKAGLPATGVIGVGDLAVLSGQVRIGTPKVAVGSPSGVEVMTVTTTTRVVLVEGEPQGLANIKGGDPVSVLLPDSTTTRGKVAAVSSGGDSPNGQAQLKITVSLDEPDAVKEATDVRVEFTGESRKGVLAVPVGALLALSEGGYGVQVVGGGLTKVETGLFARGKVEITGLPEGTKVVSTS